MVKITVRLDKRYRLSTGEYPLKLAVARGGTTFYVPLNITLSENEWDKVQGKVKNRIDKKTLNHILQETLLQANRKILALQSEGRLRELSNRELSSILSSDDTENEREHHFSYQAEKFISTIDKERTKQIYLSTIYIIKSLEEYETLRFEDMTVGWLREFDSNLAIRGLSTNTRAIHLRNIRAIFNYAIDNEAITVYPFRRFRIKTEDTKKRDLTGEQLSRILNCTDLTASQEKYRDIFILTIYLMGINMVDLSRLTKIENGRINYKRAKTGRLYSVKVEKEAMDIIERYRGKKHLIRFFDTNRDYRNFEKKLNNAMTEIAKRCGIECRVSSYWARHTFATIAASLDIPTDTISECLGHKHGSKVTAVYINFDQEKVDKALRKVIDHIIVLQMVK